MVALADFRASTAKAEAPRDLAPPVEALWWAAKGDWDKAHKIVMEEDGADAAWVHAYLHRVEGDLPNAGYWYRTAGKPVEKGALEAEWAAIVAAPCALRTASKHRQRSD